MQSLRRPIMTIERHDLDDTQPFDDFDAEAEADLMLTIGRLVDDADRAAPPTVLITEAEVKLSTAAAIGMPRTKIAWWRSAGRTIVAALRWAVLEDAPAPTK